MSEPRDDGFLGRWSRRKQAQRQGLPLDDAPRPINPPLEEKRPLAPLNTAQAATKNVAIVAPTPQTDAQPLEGTQATQATPPVPTLADVAQLPTGSDISRFVAHNVSPEVRNAAFKKLFADPHFNVMDRLDTYIDDYHTPNPLPASVVKQLAATDFLGWNRPSVDEAAKERADAAHANVAVDTAPAPTALAEPDPAAAQAHPLPTSAQSAVHAAAPTQPKPNDPNPAV